MDEQLETIINIPTHFVFFMLKVTFLSALGKCDVKSCKFNIVGFCMEIIHQNGLLIYVTVNLHTPASLTV
jgi:hypothetical protein